MPQGDAPRPHRLFGSFPIFRRLGFETNLLPAEPHAVVPRTLYEDNRTNLPPNIVGYSLSTVQFVVQILGHVGTKETIELLRPLTDDPELGKISLEAIAAIRGRYLG